MPDIAGKLFPNLTTLIVQLLSTGVLLLIFKKFLWKNVMEYFAKRADYIESTINEAKEMNEKASVNLETAEKEAREAASKYREILDQAKDDGQKVKQQIIDQANEEARAKIEQAQKEIETEDSKRYEFHKYYTDEIWGASKGYELCLDEGILGIDGCVEMILDYLKIRKLI